MTRERMTIEPNEGKNCLASRCHSQGKEHHFSLEGTIYRDVNGTAGRTGAKIKVKDATGNTTILKSDRLGNFYSEKNLKSPFIISALYEGREVKMPIPASDGGCNAERCHVVGMAGRVFISTNDLDLTGTVTEVRAGGASSEISYNRDIYKTATDNEGKFVMKAVKAGEYILKIFKERYKTHKQTYQMNQSNVTPLEIKMKRK